MCAQVLKILYLQYLASGFGDRVERFMGCWSGESKHPILTKGKEKAKYLGSGFRDRVERFMGCWGGESKYLILTKGRGKGKYKTLSVSNHQNTISALSWDGVWGIELKRSWVVEAEKVNIQFWLRGGKRANIRHNVYRITKILYLQYLGSGLGDRVERFMGCWSGESKHLILTKGRKKGKYKALCVSNHQNNISTIYCGQHGVWSWNLQLLFGEGRGKDVANELQIVRVCSEESLKIFCLPST
jgi:hypothetical protein